MPPIHAEAATNAATNAATKSDHQADPRTQRVAQFFETLSPASLAALPQVYSEQARFKDPFNDVTGLPAIRQIFEHMFATLDSPRFIVRQQMSQGEQAWLSWDFIVQRPQGELIIHGATHLHYAADGRVLLHRDYWDTAEELYAKLPVLGPLVRWLTARLSANIKPPGRVAPGWF